MSAPSSTPPRPPPPSRRGVHHRRTTNNNMFVWMAVLFYLTLSSTTTVSAQCTLCPDDGEPGNPDLIVPFLGLPDGNNNPTCQHLKEVAGDVTNGVGCDLLQAHQSYCACPGVPNTPVGVCSLCDSGQTPTKLNAETPFGDTCEELDTYLSYLPEEFCGTQRVSLIYLVDYFCGCPGSEPACPMCSDGTSNIRNGDFILPFFGNALSGEASTCRDVADFGLITSGGSSCSIVSDEASYCGCSDSPGVINACTLCENGATPSKGDFKPLEATCDELDLYISYQSPEQCNTERVQAMMRADFLCGCPGATTTCPFCPDGSNNIRFPERRPPLLGLPGNLDPTCQEVVNFAALSEEDLTADLCETFQDYAGYCGCSNVEPTNLCSFCPNGGSPSKPNLQVTADFSCSDLDDFVSYLDEEGCADNGLANIQAYAYRCGCEGAEPSCTLCKDGAEPRNGNTLLVEGTTCTTFAESITSYSEALCASQTTLIDSTAEEDICDCPGGSGTNRPSDGNGPGSSSPAVMTTTTSSSRFLVMISVAILLLFGKTSSSTW